jgi:uncharacterized protein (TIGR02145 family)
MKSIANSALIITLILTGSLILAPGCDKEDPPSITTLPVEEITGHTAKSGGNITDDGGIAVTERGVVWSTGSDPTIENNAGVTLDSAGIGEFTSILKGLSPETTYYLRAYAVNDAGTSYGEQVSFSTLQGDGTTGTVTDVDGNIYKTVIIGGTEWMAENLRTTMYNDGSEIPYQSIVDSFPEDTGSGSDNTKSYMWNENNEDYKESYGALYSWYATENSRGLCPSGWEIPGVDDWDKLLSYLMLQYGLHNDYRNENIKGVGNALKSCRQVNSPLGGECDVTEHPRWNGNITHYGTDDFGFNGLPAGAYILWGGFNSPGSNVVWWTSTEYSDTYARGRGLVASSGALRGTDKESYYKGDMHGVRCIRITE